MSPKHNNCLPLLVVCMLAALLAVGVWAGVGGLTQKPTEAPDSSQQEELATQDVAGASRAGGDTAASDAQTTSAQVEDGVSPAATQAVEPAAFVMPEGAAYEPDVVLLSVAEGVSAEDINALLASTDAVAEGVTVDEDAADGVVKLTVAEGASVEDAVNALMGSSLVEYAQPNYLYYAMGDESDLREALSEAQAPEQNTRDASQQLAGEDPASEVPDVPADQDSDDDPADAPQGEDEATAQDADTAPQDSPETAPQGGPAALMEALAVSVNDPYVDQQWALASLRAFEAWSLARCEGAVTVAVLDEYPDTSHPDLVDNTIYYDEYASSDQPSSFDVHGTHVTGIVSATTDNGIGVAGLSYNARVLAINVFNGTAADTYSVIQAYERVMASASELNVRVVNMSFGGAASTDSFSDTGIIACVNRAFNDYGIVSVAAAGNISSGTEPYYEYPGDAEKVVSVINLKRDGDGVVRNSGSNYNLEGQIAKNISAPGTLIRSTVLDDGYGLRSGTSMAAPQVSSILALEFAANPDLSAQEAVDILYATAADLGDPGFDREYGWGEADAYAAVRAAQTGDYDASAVHDLTVPAPKATGATRIPVGATATYEVTNGSMRIKSGSAATLSGKTLTGISAGTVTLALIDTRGAERSTRTVEVYDAAGPWFVASALNQSLVLDVAGGSLSDKGNVQLYTSNGTRAQAWLLELQDSGAFCVRSAKTGKVLDVASGSLESGANVQQYHSNGTVAQQWTMTVDASDRVSLRNAKSGLMLGAASTTAANKTNVCQGGGSSAAQKWVLKQTSVEMGPVWEGIYRVSSCLDGGFVLDVKGGSKAKGANVQLYRSNGSDAQRWVFTYLGNGAYKVSNLASEKVLDVAGGKLVRGANIQQYTWNGTAAQQWQLVSYEDGSFALARSGTEWVLDVQGGKAANGRNIQQYTRNDTAAQRWVLTQY